MTVTQLKDALIAAETAGHGAVTLYQESKQLNAEGELVPHLVLVNQFFVELGVAHFAPSVVGATKKAVIKPV